MPQTILEAAEQRSDLVLIDRAVRNDWPIPADVRQLAVEQCAAILKNPRAKSRSKTAAARTLAMFYRQNLYATSILLDRQPQIAIVNSNASVCGIDCGTNEDAVAARQRVLSGIAEQIRATVRDELGRGATEVRGAAADANSGPLPAT